jgi:predicted permease
MFAWGPITVEGRVPAAGEEFINVDIRIVGGHYFDTMEIPLMSGRHFDDQDTREKPRVAIIDERMARELWPDESAIGKRVRTGGLTSTNPWITVIGVAGRVKQYTLDTDSRMAMYLPHSQYPTRAMNLVLKSAQPPGVLTAAVRDTVRALDPELPIFNVRSMDDRVDESLAQRRFAMQLLTLFAAIALVLAAIGIYGVMSYLVSQGTRELGIRLALGATPRDVVWLVGRQTVVIATAGVSVGVVIAVAVTRFMQSLLFEVDAVDPFTFALIAAFLLTVACVAGFVPVRRAAHIDPLRSLRTD